MTERLPISEADVQAYADGRLAEGRRAELDAWLATRPADAERVAAYRRLNEELRALYDPVLVEPVPERLRTATAWRSRLRGVAAALAWLAIGAGIGAVAGWHMHRPSPAALAQDNAPDFVRRAAIAHATYSPEVRHPVEVGAD
jgi:anti-sigma factor RsiW